MLFALLLALALQSIAPASGVTGVLKSEAGRPLAHAKVLACMAKVCLIGETAADGRFNFSIDPPADIVIKTEEDLLSTPRRGAAMMPVRLADRRLADVGVVRVPNLPTGRAFASDADAAQTMQAGDGLELTLSRQALKPQPGDAIVDLAARRLPGPYPPLGPERIIAIYALHPFAAKSATPIAVRVPNTVPGLAAGTPIRFRTINEIDGTFSPPVRGEARGRFLTTDPGSGITELTYLVISRAGR